MSTRPASMVSGHPVYAMDDHSRFSRLSNKILQMSQLRIAETGRPNRLSCFNKLQCLVFSHGDSQCSKLFSKVIYLARPVCRRLASRHCSLGLDH